MRTILCEMRDPHYSNFANNHIPRIYLFSSIDYLRIYYLNFKTLVQCDHWPQIAAALVI